MPWRDDAIIGTNCSGYLSVDSKLSRARKKRSGIARHGWVKLREDIFKLNVDVGFSVESGTGSTGAIIRDERWFFIAASSCGIRCINS